MSRELYDLCRKYKHFYNKHRDVKCWDQKYHDIDLSDAVAKTKIDLGLVEHEIQKELFKIFDVECSSIDVSHDWERIPVTNLMGRCHPIPPSFNATIEIRNGNRFVNVLSEYVTEKCPYYHYERWK